MSRQRPDNFSPAPQPIIAPIFAKAGDDGQEGESIDFRAYWRIVKQNLWQILAYGVLFGLIGLLIGFRATPIYRADVKLLAEPVEARVNGSNQWVSTALVWLFYETQKEIILSRNIALKVVDDLDLVDYYAHKAAGEEEAAPTLFSLDWRLWLPEAWRGEPKQEPDREQQRLALADRVVGGLSVDIGKDSQVITISYDSPDPELAARVANAVAASYRDFGLSSRMSTAQQQTLFLNQQLAELRDKVTRAEQALQDYQQREGLIDSESRGKMISAELAGLSQQLIAAQAKRSEAEIRYREVQRLRNSPDAYDSLAAVLNSSLISKLREKQSELYRRVSELSERYGEKHPKMIAARSELAEATRVLKKAVDKVVGGLKQEYEVARKQEQKLRSLIARSKDTVQALRGKGFELAKYEREAENARQVYEEYLSRLNELDVTGDYDVSNVRVIDQAVVPGAPYKPNKVRILLGATFLGLLVGVLVAFLRDRLDASFRLLEHAEERLGLPGLGIVPLVRAKEIDSPPERVVEHAPHSPFAESINHIRTGILFSNIDNPPKVVMVTSSAAGEGKTTLAVNLAASFAQMGRTLLVEADLRRPRLADVFDIDSGLGLTDLIVTPDQAQACLARPRDGLDLHVLPAGSSLPNPLEFLSSEAFSRMLEVMAKRFAHIIIDAPPVLPVSDSIVMSRLADAVIMAVRADHTNDRTAREAVKRLRAAHIAPVGVVLTQANIKRMADFGGNHYADYSYYGGDHGYGHREADGSKAASA